MTTVMGTKQFYWIQSAEFQKVKSAFWEKRQSLKDSHFVFIEQFPKIKRLTKEQESSLKKEKKMVKSQIWRFQFDV